jgi:hypothetical protein
MQRWIDGYVRTRNPHERIDAEELVARVLVFLVKRSVEGDARQRSHVLLDWPSLLE